MKEKALGAFHVELHPMSSRAFSRVRIYIYICLGLYVVEHSISVGDLAKRAARIADGDDACRDIACDDAACSDHGALADGDATEDGQIRRSTRCRQSSRACLVRSLCCAPRRVADGSGCRC